MAQGDRHYSGMATVLSVDGEDLIGLFTDVELTLTTDLQEARAAQDVWAWPVGRISSWRLTINKVIDDEGATMALKLAGASLPILWESASVDGMSLSGNALLSEYGHTWPDSDGQRNALTLVGQGQPTLVSST